MSVKLLNLEVIHINSHEAYNEVMSGQLSLCLSAYVTTEILTTRGTKISKLKKAMLQDCIINEAQWKNNSPSNSPTCGTSALQQMQLFGRGKKKRENYISVIQKTAFWGSIWSQSHNISFISPGNRQGTVWQATAVNQKQITGPLKYISNCLDRTHKRLP